MASGDADPAAGGAAVVRWNALGPRVAATLQAEVEGLVADVLASVVPGAPREWVAGSPNARHGVERGLHGLLELIERGPRDELPGRGLYYGFGRGQQRAGRPLGGLLAAYHHGARAAWQAIAQRGRSAGLDGETLSALADAILAYLAEISAASAEGFAHEQASGASDRDDRRRQLVARLVRPPGPPPVELRALAAAAGWRAGPATAVALLAFAPEHARTVATRLAADAVVAAVDGVGYAVLADPRRPGLHSGLRRRLTPLRAALGPAVALPRSSESARLARLALGLAGVREPLVLADEHRVDLLLLSAPSLAATLAAELLAPLDALPAATGERLLETLAAWLRHHGMARAAAEELRVHTQTVRYRVGRLRGLLGARLDEAEGRLELELALRARRLRAAGGAQPQGSAG